MKETIDASRRGPQYRIAVILLERCLFGAPGGLGLDVDLESGPRLVDWSGSEVDLALGAPDLYPIRSEAEEE